MTELITGLAFGGTRAGLKLADDIVKNGIQTGAQALRRTGLGIDGLSKLGASAALKADDSGTLLRNLVNARTGGDALQIDAAAKALGDSITSKFADELVDAKVFDNALDATEYLKRANIGDEVVKALKEGANPRSVADASRVNGLTRAASQSPEAATRAISKTIDDTLPAAQKPPGGWPIGKIIGWSLAAGIASAILIPALIRYIEKKNYRGKVQRIVFQSTKVAIHYAPSIQLNGRDQIGLLNVREPVEWLGEGENVVYYSQTPSTSAQTSITAEGSPRENCGSGTGTGSPAGSDDANTGSCGDMRIEPDFAAELGQAAHDLFRGIANLLGGALGGLFGGSWWIWVLVACGVLILIVVIIFIIRAARKKT